MPILPRPEVQQVDLVQHVLIDGDVDVEAAVTRSSTFPTTQTRMIIDAGDTSVSATLRIRVH